jgi:glycosyltransferase involved in cell wall biosynthesis
MENIERLSLGDQIKNKHPINLLPPIFSHVSQLYKLFRHRIYNIIKMIVPLVVIFGLKDPDLTHLKSEDIKILSTHETDEDLKQILIDDHPDVLITVGEDHSQFPNFRATPFFIKRKWLHYKNFQDVTPKKIMHCYMTSITQNNPDYPLISIFTTTYKSAHKIQRPYRSLIGQTYKDWEWVIMDDSDDDGETYEMLKELASTDYRIRLYKDSKHSGYIGKMKRDVAMMGNGDILIELDHDDDIMSNTLSLIKEAFAMDPEIGFVYSDYSEIYENGQNFNYSEQYAYGYGSYTKALYNGGWINVAQSVPFNGSTLRHIVGVPNHIRSWRASAYRELGGNNPNLHVADDYELILRTFLKYRVCRIPKCLYIQYRNRGGNNFTFIRNREIQKLVRHIWPVYKDEVLQKLDDMGVYSVDRDRAKDWEKDPAPLEVLRGSELTYDPKSNDVSIVLIAGKHRKDLIRSIKSVIAQTDRNWRLYVIGAGNKILEAVMNSDEFKRHDIFWWNLESVRSEVRDRTIINYATKMLITSDIVTYIRTGTEWNPEFLKEQIEKLGDDRIFSTASDDIESTIHERNLLSECGYYDSTDEEFIERLKKTNT